MLRGILSIPFQSNVLIMMQIQLNITMELMTQPDILLTPSLQKKLLIQLKKAIQDEAKALGDTGKFENTVPGS